MNDQWHTPLEEAAAHLHELFSSFVTVGFTEDQALRLTVAALSNLMDKEE